MPCGHLLGKGLTSWVSFVVSNCESATFPFVPGLVLDCFDPDIFLSPLTAYYTSIVLEQLHCCRSLCTHKAYTDNWYTHIHMLVSSKALQQLDFHHLWLALEIW